MAKRPKPDSDPASLSFEDALEEVESIIERIESGEIGLEESIKAYERGAALVERCRSALEVAEQRVAELDRRSLKPAASPPDDDDDSSAPPTGADDPRGR